MADGSIDALFSFCSFKIDKINLRLTNKLGYLSYGGTIKPEMMQMFIKLRPTEKFLIDDNIQYVGGLDTQVKCMDETLSEIMLQSEFGISGIFSAAMTIDKKLEENFTKISLPALLMPYLRAEMTNVLSCAGFGTVLFPLVNIYELAKQQNLSIIDHTIPAQPQIPN
jgi:preprotein translocase subunit SecB